MLSPPGAVTCAQGAALAVEAVPSARTAVATATIREFTTPQYGSARRAAITELWRRRRQRSSAVEQREHRPPADDLAVAGEQRAVDEGQCAAEPLALCMRGHPVVLADRAEEVGGEAHGRGGDLVARALMGRADRLADREVDHRHQQPALGLSERVQVALVDAQPEH